MEVVIETCSLEMVAGTKGSSWKPDSHSSALIADRNPRDGEYVCEDCVEHYYCNTFDRLSQSAAECVSEGRERQIAKFWYLSWR